MGREENSQVKREWMEVKRISEAGLGWGAGAGRSWPPLESKP